MKHRESYQDADPLLTVKQRALIVLVFLVVGGLVALITHLTQ